MIVKKKENLNYQMLIYLNLSKLSIYMIMMAHKK